MEFIFQRKGLKQKDLLVHCVFFIFFNTSVQGTAASQHGTGADKWRQKSKHRSPSQPSILAAVIIKAECSELHRAGRKVTEEGW